MLAWLRSQFRYWRWFLAMTPDGQFYARKSLAWRDSPQNEVLYRRWLAGEPRRKGKQ